MNGNNEMPKETSSGATTVGLLAGVATGVATGSGLMAAAGFGLGYGLKKLHSMYKESPNAGGKHAILNKKQFK
jgi:hypothetical protein